KNVKWQSLDPSIVRVDAKGKLTAVSQGTTNVIATTEAEGRTASCKVTVVYSGKWIKDSKGWWFQYNSGGYPRNGWSLVSGKYYYFDANGYMKTGWLSVGGKWYYLGSDGARKTGWQKVGASWYYLNNSGVMATGWVKLGNTWYYMNGSGAML
ncbi:Ig-like domain-containing protein, partial [Lactonifactor longoviformis]